MDKLGEAAENYLKYHQHSIDALTHVRDVLSRFEFMVDLNRSRALEALYIPSNVVQLRLVETPPDMV